MAGPMRKSSDISKPKLVPLDRFIYSKIADGTFLHDNDLRKVFPRFKYGAIKGALYRLKVNNWIVYVPSLKSHMTTAAYKRRLEDGLYLDTDTSQ